MPVMTRSKHAALVAALGHRATDLMEAMEPRPLATAREGASGRSVWQNPDAMVATKADAMALRLKLADFEAVLKEVKAVAK